MRSKFFCMLERSVKCFSTFVKSSSCCPPARAGGVSDGRRSRPRSSPVARPLLNAFDQHQPCACRHAKAAGGEVGSDGRAACATPGQRRFADCSSCVRAEWAGRTGRASPAFASAAPTSRLPGCCTSGGRVSRLVRLAKRPFVDGTDGTTNGGSPAVQRRPLSRTSVR